MRQTSVRKIGNSLGDLSHLNQADRIAVLREKMAGMVASESQINARRIAQEQDFLSVPQELADILPGAGLLRGQLVELTDSAMLVVQLIAHTSGNNGFVAVLGWPSLSLAGVEESGGDLRRVVVIPELGEQALDIVTMLAEGIDLIIYRHTGQPLVPTHARQLVAKLRNAQAVVIAVGMRLPVQTVRIAATISGFRGISNGSGRIRAVDLTLQSHIKGCSRQGRMAIGRQRDLTAV